MKIEDIDKNFKIETKIDKPNIKFYSIDEPPFVVNGIFKQDGKYHRMPEDIAKSVNEGVYSLQTHTAGGRVRFTTDSSYIAIHTVYDSVGNMPHFAMTGSAGFDIYERQQNIQTYLGTFFPPLNTMENESVIDVNGDGLHEYVINFPLYSGIKEVYIGLNENSKILKPTDYKHNLPIVYYGSSITQGGCASRPGNSYQSIISRIIDCDFINLGFSGNALGEENMANYIKDLKMSCFVYDYDHNAPSVEHLEKTHENMFEIIRKQNPNLPIIIMTRPKFHLSDEEKMRLKIVETTYKNAINSGDNNVYFIPGPSLIDINTIETATVDNCHPNDSGFLSIALKLSEILNKIFE